MNDPQGQGVADVNPAGLLKRSREAAGLHIAALAAALKVPVRKLEALEAGRYDELPDLTFARALASSACRQLKIDPAPVLAEIPSARTPQLGDVPGAINAPFRGSQEPQAFSPWGWLSRPAVLTAIALLLGALVIVFLPQAQVSGEATTPLMPPDQTATDTTAPAEAAPAPLAATETVSETAPVAVDATAVPALPGVASAAPVVPAPAAAPAAPAAPVAPAAPLMGITATGDTWLEVTGAGGAVLLQRLLKAGETVDFSTAPPYNVVLGRADAVRITVRGQAFDVTPFVRNSVARFEVK